MGHPAGDGAWAGSASGGCPASGPPPDAVAVVAQRLLAIAGEFSGLRLPLDQVATVEWRSPSAGAFRAELEEACLALASAVRSVEDAAGAVARYAAFLASGSSPGSWMGPGGAGGFPYGMPGAP